MKSSISFSASLILMGMAFGASAQTMKPGLWEISNKIQSASGEMEKGMADMQKEMAAMPPEQRKMMQDMMAKQGVDVGASGLKSMGVKVCITKEMADRNELTTAEGDCKSTNAPRVGNTMKFSFACTKPPSSGEGQITFIGTDAYTSKTTVSSARNGKAESMSIDSQGKWLSAECGAIKPLVVPRK